MLDDLEVGRKRIRLEPEDYARSGAICSITVCAANRTGTFLKGGYSEACIALLKERAEITGVPIHAYCLMPDHLHLLISPGPNTPISEFVRDFKSRSTRLAWQYGYTGKTWQASYYDHFLRKDEDVEVAVSYILNNPVRKEMVEEWSQYPYCGSMVYDL